jgi:hypothetical protein
MIKICLPLIRLGVRQELTCCICQSPRTGRHSERSEESRNVAGETLRFAQGDSREVILLPTLGEMDPPRGDILHSSPFVVN